MLINTSNNPITLITTLLAAIGALNWGLVGCFNLNLVSFIFGEMTTLTRIVYILVGLSGIYVLLTLIRVIGSPAVNNVK